MIYEEQPDQVMQTASQLAQAIQANLSPASKAEGLPEVQVLQAAADFYRQRFDATSGGTQCAPKFPSNLPIRLLLRYARRTDDDQAREMATLTLEKMAGGGMYDHVGGGFHRYSTDARWLREAIALDTVLETHYEDQQAGGFFMTSNDHETLLAREKPSYDGAEPSGNSVRALNLLRLHEFTTEDRYRVRAEKTLQAFDEILQRAPAAMSELLLAVDYHLDTPKEIVIVTPKTRAEAEPFLARLGKTFLPNRVLTIVAEGEDLAAQATLIPLVESKTAQGGKPTAYVCEQRVCELPTTDPAVFAKQISKVHMLTTE